MKMHSSSSSKKRNYKHLHTHSYTIWLCGMRHHFHLAQKKRQSC